MPYDIQGLAVALKDFFCAKYNSSVDDLGFSVIEFHRALRFEEMLESMCWT